MGVLFRADKEEWLKKILHEGIIRFAPISSWTNQELGLERYDNWENKSVIIQPRKVESFFIGKRNIKQNLAGPVLISLPGRPTHAFCMSYISYRELKRDKFFNINQWKKFGDSLLVISDPKMFQNAIATAIKLRFPQINSETTFFKVKYVPHNYSGEYNAYKKRKVYQWQREVRFVLNCPLMESHYIDINCGSIKDFGGIYKSENWTIELK